MKKFLTLLLSILLVSSLCGCKQKNRGEIVTAEAPVIKAMFESGQTFVMYAGTKTCTSCKEFKVTLGELIYNYPITIYYMPADEFESPEVKEVIYNYLYKLEWTPSTYIVQNGKAVDMREEPLEYDDLVEWLEKYDALPY